MFGGVIDMAVGGVLGWVLHAYGWTWLVAWAKAKIAAVAADLVSNPPK